MAQRKKYRTAKGVTFDMDQFIQSNESAVAAGKMGGRNVNARGDILGKGGIVIKQREKVVRDYYRQELPVVKEQSVKEPVVSQMATPTKVEIPTTFDNPADALSKIEQNLRAETKQTKRKAKK